ISSFFFFFFFSSRRRHTRFSRDWSSDVCSSDLRAAEVSLYIHTHVREDTLALYGFLRREEKQLFERLIGVSGIGPKLAITVLSGIAADALVTALRGNDITALTRIPGVGKKTAERMMLEL